MVSDSPYARFVPSRAGDARFGRWFAKVQRTSVSPRAAQRFVRAMVEVDVRPILPLVQAPTLTLHRRDVQSPRIEQLRYLAEHIPGRGWSSSQEPTRRWSGRRLSSPWT